MKKIAITILLIFFTPALLFSDEILKPEYQKVVKPFITALSNNDVIAIYKIIRYPLKRDYPIPSIMNAEELIERFDQYKYRVHVINVYEEEQTPPGFLEVLISDKVILEQDIEKFIKQ